jgi:hypothetical protein
MGVEVVGIADGKIARIWRYDNPNEIVAAPATVRSAWAEGYSSLKPLARQPRRASARA